MYWLSVKETGEGERDAYLKISLWKSRWRVFSREGRGCVIHLPNNANNLSARSLAARAVASIVLWLELKQSALFGLIYCYYTSCRAEFTVWYFSFVKLKCSGWLVLWTVYCVLDIGHETPRINIFASSTCSFYKLLYSCERRRITY